MNEKSIKILIIEDNPDDLFLIKKAVETDRFSCTYISSGQEAFDLLLAGEYEPDIVLVDNQLPLMNGLEILENLNREGKEFSYIFLTIDNSIETVVKAMNLGALDFIVKSASLQDDLPYKIEKVYKIHKNRIEKKKMELDLIKAKNIAEENVMKYQTLVDAAFDPIIVTRNKVIIELNKRASEVSGYSYDELLGKKAMTLLVGNGEDVNRYLDYHNGKDIESMIRRKDGKLRSVIINSRKSVLQGQEVLISSIRDVTESRIMEKKMRLSEKMSAIGQLAGGIAHDFNNQLSPIMGYADMLCHQLENPQHRKFAQNILHSAIRSADLTKKLLSFARKGQIILEQVNVVNLLNISIELFERGSDKNINIIREFSLEPLVVSADAGQLEHALMNILINGRDAIGSSGTITVKTESIRINRGNELYVFNHLEEGDYVKITISDTGSGIPDKLKKNIFEPFFTTKDVGKGIGMGLASAYGAIKEHSGYISFSSEEGKGTDFYIFLPKVINFDGFKKIVSDVEVGKAKNSKILIVDDEEMLRTMITDILESDNHVVNGCSNGREALEIFRESEQTFDLIILDMTMPELDGYKTFKQMKDIDPDVKVLISSGYNMKKEFNQMKEEGVIGFLSKPYKINELREQIINILG